MNSDDSCDAHIENILWHVAVSHRKSPPRRQNILLLTRETSAFLVGLVSWQIDEIVIPTSDTVEMSREITTRYGRNGLDPKKPSTSHIIVYPDPAGAQRRTSAQGKTDLSLLHDAGFVVRALQSHPLVHDRTNLVNARFESADGKRHVFVSPKCRKSIECYERLAYEEGTSEPDKDSGYDHLPDSAGYYFFARFSHKPVFRTNVGHMGR
jgi:hypothetical protein